MGSEQWGQVSTLDKLLLTNCETTGVEGGEIPPLRFLFDPGYSASRNSGMTVFILREENRCHQKQ